MNQHDRSAQCKRIGHSLILGAPIRKVGGIDGQHHAGVAGHLKLRDTALAQFHDPLRHLQLHAAAAIVLLVKAPRKPQGMLTDHRTANIFFIIPPPLIVVYWLTISILTAAIFRVNANVSYKHTK